MEITQLISAFAATGMLSNTEIDFLEGELWETMENIQSISSLKTAPNEICFSIGLPKGSPWYQCIAEVLDKVRPKKFGNARSEVLSNLLREYTDLIKN
tara:strand:+ start:720 stop:1013 length:294 start_codon:yes stop_codon:yes gene_type:complete